jgi:hypothetical protein
MMESEKLVAHYKGIYGASKGDWKEAEPHLQRSISLSERVGDALTFEESYVMLGTVQFLRVSDM